MNPIDSINSAYPLSLPANSQKIDGTGIKPDPADSFTRSPATGVSLSKASKLVSYKSDNLRDAVTLWKYDVHHFDPRASVGPDQRIYEKGLCDDTLRCLAPDGTIVWEKKMKSTLPECPAASPKGTVLVSNVLSLEAYNPDGTLKFDIPLPDSKDIRNNSLSTNLSVGPEGNAYVHDAMRLFAVSPEGKLLWTKKLSPAWRDNPPVVGKDGIVYAVDRQNTVYAFEPGGKLKWKNSDLFQEKPALPDVTTALAVGPDGSVYFGIRNSKWDTKDCRLIALDSRGKEKWSIPTDSELSNYEDPDVDQKTGIIYTGSGRDGKEVWAVSPDGKVLWKKDVGPVLHITSLPEGQGVVVGIKGGDLHAFDNEGKPLWTFHTGDIFSKPTLGPDGVLYVGSRQALYAIESRDRFLEEKAGDMKKEILESGPGSDASTITGDESWIIIDGVKLPVHDGPAAR